MVNAGMMIIKDQTARKSMTQQFNLHNFNGKCCYDDHERSDNQTEDKKRDFWAWCTKMLY